MCLSQCGLTEDQLISTDAATEALGAVLMRLARFPCRFRCISITPARGQSEFFRFNEFGAFRCWVRCFSIWRRCFSIGLAQSAYKVVPVPINPSTGSQKAARKAVPIAALGSLGSSWLPTPPHPAGPRRHHFAPRPPSPAQSSCWRGPAPARAAPRRPPAAAGFGSCLPRIQPAVWLL